MDVFVPICSNEPASRVNKSHPQLTSCPSIDVTAAPAKIGTKVALKNGRRIITIHVNIFVNMLILGLTSSGVLFLSGVVTPQYPICSPSLPFVGVIFI